MTRPIGFARIATFTPTMPPLIRFSRTGSGPSALRSSRKYSAACTSPWFAVSRTMMSDSGLRICSSAFEFAGDARPTVARATFPMMAARFFSTCPASGASVLNMFISAWKPLCDGSDSAQFLNRAVSFTTPPVICVDIGRNAFRTPHTPATTFPSAWPRSRITGRTFGSSTLTTFVSPPASIFRVSSVTSVSNAFAAASTSGDSACSTGLTSLSAVCNGARVAPDSESAHLR